MIDIDAVRANNQLDKPIKKFDSRGVMTESIFSYLKLYHPTVNTNIDYMHSVLYGVVKKLFFYWFEKTEKKELGKKKLNFSLKDQMEVISEKLLRVRPPGYIQSYPRPLSTWNLWRCHEYLSFILFYALIVFKDTMTKDYYENLVNLVIPLEILLSSSIRRDALDSVDKMLNDFVRDLSKLYGEDIMVSGFHELLHLVNCTKQFGPFNSTNCFQFEELNRKVVQLIKGRSLIGEEFYKLFTVAQSLSTFTNNIQFSNPLIAKFVSQYSIIKSSNKKKTVENDFHNISVSCKIKYLINPVFSELLNKYNKTNLIAIPTVKRLYNNNILYTDESNESKFCDNFIKDKSNNNYGSIVLIIYDSETKKALFLIQKYVYLYHTFFNPKYLDVKSRTICCTKSPDYFISSIDDIEKCFFYRSETGLCYASAFKINHLFT